MLDYYTGRPNLIPSELLTYETYDDSNQPGRKYTDFCSGVGDLVDDANAGGGLFLANQVAEWRGLKWDASATHLSGFQNKGFSPASERA